MLIVLEVERESNNGIVKKIKSLFHPYEIKTKIKKQNKVSVLYIRYKAYRGEIRFKKIYELAIGAPKTILCSKDIVLDNSPFKRFDNNEFNVVMMQNFICSILKKADIPPEKLNIAYYDPMAENPLFAEKLLEYTSKLTVVSNMPKFYEKESERIADSIGVPLLVSNSPERLSGCDIVVCPQKIDMHLPVSENTIVFTSSKPAVSLKSAAIYEYFPEFPYKYKRLKSRNTDDIYFLSALYSLCGVKELSRLIPLKGGDGNVMFTSDRLVHRLKSLKADDELMKII